MTSSINLKGLNVSPKFDLKLDYHQLKVKEEDIFKSVFWDMLQILRITCDFFWLDEFFSKVHKPYDKLFKLYLNLFMIMYMNISWYTWEWGWTCKSYNISVIHGLGPQVVHSIFEVWILIFLIFLDHVVSREGIKVYSQTIEAQKNCQAHYINRD